MRKRVPGAVSLCMMAAMLAVSAQGMQTWAAETEVQTELAEETAPDPEEKETESEAKETKETKKESSKESDSDSAESETESETSRVGELTFAKCEDYINIRTEPSKKGEITAKIYNHDSAVIVSEEDGWYEIQSGNAHGYVKAEYFAVGEEAEAIAEEVAYNVATVQAKELNVRDNPDTESDVIEVAFLQDELEVVAYGEDWMKVALGNDVYGYISADYVTYETYYPTAETLEEEAIRLEAESEAAAEAAAALEETETETEPVYEEEYIEETEPVYVETEPVYTETEPVYTETEPVYTETEPVYTETEPVYTETEPVYTETEPVYTETEPVYTETEPVYTETETEYVQETEAASSNSGVGQQIADFAVQYVGNPYVWGGTSLTNGADCSGFVQTVFANFGIGLARIAENQAAGGTPVSTDSLLPGDLLFYSSSGTIDHVAIYIGNGTIVHAANSDSGIITSSAYYSTIVAARRYW